MNRLPRLLPEGCSAMGANPADLYDGEAVRFRLSQSVTLGDIEKEAVLFTCALFSTHGRLVQDVVQEYVNQADDMPVISLVELDAPVFSGMIQPLSRILVAVDRHHWEECFRFLTAVSIKDTPRKIYYQCLPHVVWVADSLALKKFTALPEKVPMVRVMVFGLDGNKRQVVVRPAMNPPLDLPRVSVEQPRPATVELARKIFSGDSKPYETSGFSASSFLEKGSVLHE